MVTAELAVVAPFGLAFAALLSWIVSLGITQVRLTDATREAARLLGRGESAAEAVEAARRLAPDGTVFTVSTRDGLVRVRATAVSAPLGFDAVGERTVRADATAVLEAGP